MSTVLTENERRIFDVFANIIPRLSDMEKEKLLSYGEGIGAFKDMQASAAYGDKKEETDNDADSHR